MNQTSFRTESLPKKLVIISLMTLGYLIPILLISSQISDRKGNESNAQLSIEGGWGRRVWFNSPSVDGHANSAPAKAETEIEVRSIEKKRGVFHVPVFTSIYKSRFSFSRLAPPPVSTLSSIPSTSSKPIKKGASTFIVLEITPQWPIQNYEFKDAKTGKKYSGTFVDQGIKITFPEDEDIYDREFIAEISTRGTGEISYASKADEESVLMKGNWPKPQFLDQLLPSESTSGKDGFSAKWKLIGSTDVEGKRSVNRVGMNHLWLKSDYAKVDRATRYALLFIALTFVLLFIVELISKKSIHPLQYALIGLSISVFYLLLLAISEVTSFDVAYLISTGAVTALITFYSYGFIRDARFVIGLLGEQIVLSSFFFVLLELEERSFLIGSIGLFIALAAFMILTRRFDWYSNSSRSTSQQIPPVTPNETIA